MDKGNTKREIITAALDLFSTQGFEATSISQIADAVGIRKASLYSHFESKQAILDALVREILEQYGNHSIFTRTDWAIALCKVETASWRRRLSYNLRRGCKSGKKSDILYSS